MSRTKPLPTRRYCTCDGPFGCAMHDANLDGLTADEIASLPPELLMSVVMFAAGVMATREQCNGEVYAIECEAADELVDALRKLALARTK